VQPIRDPSHPLPDRRRARRRCFSRYFLNSSVVAVLPVVSNVLFGSMAGYAFARLRFPGRDLHRGLHGADPLVQIGLVGFVHTHVAAWNLLMAGAMIAAVPMLVVYAVARPYFAQSLGALGTGVKE
jgi:multiple sugar transport system permease protein